MQDDVTPKQNKKQQQQKMFIKLPPSVLICLRDIIIASFDPCIFHHVMMAAADVITIYLFRTCLFQPVFFLNVHLNYCPKMRKNIITASRFACLERIQWSPSKEKLSNARTVKVN